MWEIMLLMLANPLGGQEGGAWDLEIETFWLCEMASAVPSEAQKVEILILIWMPRFLIRICRNNEVDNTFYQLHVTFTLLKCLLYKYLLMLGNMETRN
jgi:hypothetical protein